MPQLVSQLLFHTIHNACRIFDKVVAFLVFLVLLWGKVRTCISFVRESLGKIQNANRNLHTCNIQLRQVRLCKRFIVYVLHRTTWHASIVSLKYTTKTTITAICWWDFIETHVYHIIQNTIFPKKFILHRLQAKVSLPDILSGFNSYDAGDPHTKQSGVSCWTI